MNPDSDSDDGFGTAVLPNNNVSKSNATLCQ